MVSRGPPKQRQRKTQRPLTKNAEDKKRTTNKHPKSNRYLRGLCAHALRGGFGGDTAAQTKHNNLHFTAELDPRGCHNARTPRILRGFLNPRLSRRTLSARLIVVFRGLVLPWPPARNRKTRQTVGLRVAVSLVWLLGPRGPPEGARRGPGAPKGTQNTTYSVDLNKNH